MVQFDSMITASTTIVATTVEMASGFNDRSLKRYKVCSEVLSA